MSQLPTTKTSTKSELRTRRHARVRSRINGTPERPRLAFSKSNRFVSAQLIDDVAGRTLVAAHGRAEKGAKKQVSLSVQAAAVGKEIAQKAKTAGIKTVVFDRAGFSYEGQVKALADAAREGGLAF
ncbi:50S ribosomal protein L18 [Patescibacteria group bacterium]|nr:50S ribosomal protein L18 [Patescibacteria group bacterium]